MARSGQQGPHPGRVQVEEPTSSPPLLSESPAAFEDRVAEPARGRVGLKLLGLRKERSKPWVAVMLLMSLVIRRNDEKDVVPDTAALFASAVRADEAGFEEP